MSSKKTKKKRKALSGAVAISNEQVIIEYWEIQQQKQPTSHLGLSHFLLQKPPFVRASKSATQI